MTQTFATTNDTNDLYIGEDGNLVIATGLQAVLQACRTAAKAQLGEMVLETDRGIPNFQLIWNGVPNYPQWEASVRATLLSVDGVVEILSFEMGKVNDILAYRATIKTIYGEGTI